jgi:hypothetical protein
MKNYGQILIETYEVLRTRRNIDVIADRSACSSAASEAIARREEPAENIESHLNILCVRAAKTAKLSSTRAREQRTVLPLSCITGELFVAA